MSLTINTHPTKTVINAPEFNVTTSLTEGASFQDLRVRATIYMGGESEAIAVLEQPKGIDDWNFFNLLKDRIGKCNAAVGGSALMIQPTLSVELLTAWGNYLGGWDTFTTLGRDISSAINNSGGVANAFSDTLTISKGDLIVVGVESGYVDTAANKVALKLQEENAGVVHDAIQYAGLTSGELTPNGLYFFLATEDSYTAPQVQMVGNNPATFAGTFSIHKITDYKNNPAVYFKVKFEEVYENGSNVTTIGAESLSDAMLFIPVIVRPGETFNSNFLIDGDNTGELLSRSVATKYKYNIDMEIRLLAAMASGVWINSYYDDGSEHIGSLVANAGWAMMIANDTTIAGMTATLASFTIGVREENEDWDDVLIEVTTELNCFPDIKVLSFVGDLGEETVIFRGAYSEVGGASKSFYADSNRTRKVLKAFRNAGMVLRTIFETEGTRRLLHELCYAELPVWMYDTDFTDNYRDVTVITDAVEIENQKELLETAIEVEFYE